MRHTRRPQETWIRVVTLQLALSAGTEGGGLYSMIDGAACLKGVMGRGDYNRWVIVDASVGRVEPVSTGPVAGQW